MNAGLSAPAPEQTAMISPKSKYPYTRQLIQIAKDVGGLTHEQIARKARLNGKSKSQVTRWAKGTSKATYEQMESLIAAYGVYLKKQIEHVYYTHVPQWTPDKIDALSSLRIIVNVCGEEKTIARLNQEEWGTVTQCPPSQLSFSSQYEDDFNKAIEILSSIDGGAPRFTYFKLKGEKVFQHTLHHSIEYKKTTKRYALHRIQIIRQTESAWFIVTQRRACLLSPRTDIRDPPTLPVHSSAEASIWWSQCHKRASVPEVIAFIDAYPKQYYHHGDCRAEACATLPFLIRSKFSELGYQLEEIVDMSEE